MLVEGILAVEPEALEIGVEDEVDNARDRVRTIDRRGTAGQHVDPVNERGRNDVDVGGRRAGVARQQTAAVHQHQGALRPEAATVDGRGAGRAVGDFAALAGRSEERSGGKGRDRTGETRWWLVR